MKPAGSYKQRYIDKRHPSAVFPEDFRKISSAVKILYKLEKVCTNNGKAGNRALNWCNTDMNVWHRLCTCNGGNLGTVLCFVFTANWNRSKQCITKPPSFSFVSDMSGSHLCISSRCRSWQQPSEGVQPHQYRCKWLATCRWYLHLHEKLWFYKICVTGNSRLIICPFSCNGSWGLWPWKGRNSTGCCLVLNT